MPIRFTKIAFIVNVSFNVLGIAVCIYKPNALRDSARCMNVSVQTAGCPGGLIKVLSKWAVILN